MISTKLDRFINNEERVNYKNYSLLSVIRLLSFFGNPHKMINCVHIAGTNGKGSVAHAVSRILTGSGYRTGLYVSPHLERINERISIDGAEIPEDVMDRYSDDLIRTLRGNRGIRPTYFDILTLFAFRYFHEQSVDAAVLETGLGGRLDSTNVVKPLLSIITDVDYDHMPILGSDLAAITREKAGIIKRGITVVTSNDSSPMYDILSEKAGSLGSPLLALNKDFFASAVMRKRKSIRFDFRCDHPLLEISMTDLAIPPLPIFQVRNFAMAITASLLLSSRYPKITETGIRETLENCTIPGRYMKLNSRPLVIFDPAHNYRAVTSVVEELARGTGSKAMVVVLSMMKDKDHDGVIKWLNSNKYDTLYVNLPGERSFRWEGEARNSRNIVSVGGIMELHREIFKKKNIRCILFTGSFRLFTTAREFALYLKLKNR